MLFILEFEYFQDWSSVPGPEVTSDCEPEGEAGGRESAQSLTSDTSKGQRGVTPPGDEIWAQKCHELDFQVRNSEKQGVIVVNRKNIGQM